ncbi:MAG: hypothetical protein CL596_11355 [Alteromonas sp.]|nr:hypothetical protein [Alteromonas sp.]MAY23551.1 hypothetical protein [Flavobacteriaceae bacterium]|tara:strand:- start:24384 stop:24932 length:549 start_codon:yes stop_codon:yes gene_type:complete
MTTAVKYVTLLALALAAMVSCDNGKSLQRYLVDKQEDDRFLKVDIATSLFMAEENNFTEEEKDIFSTIKKINVVAYPVKSGNEAEYESEKAIVKGIIDQEKYKTLGKVKSNDMMMTMKYLGEETAIDEVIVFASSSEKGFGVFRLLCDDMRPDQALKLMNTLERGDIDLSKLSGIEGMFEAM